MLSCKRRCNVVLRLQLDLSTRSAHPKGYGGGGGVPTPPVSWAMVSCIKKWSDPKPPLNGFVARFGRQRASNGAKKLSLGRLEAQFFQNLKYLDCATDSLFRMFLNKNTIQNDLNIVKVCALHYILDALAFFRYIYAPSCNFS